MNYEKGEPSHQKIEHETSSGQTASEVHLPSRKSGELKPASRFARAFVVHDGIDSTGCEESKNEGHNGSTVAPGGTQERGQNH